MAVSSFDAARRICELGNWSVTNLALQKILYISHMFFMGKNAGRPLIYEPFEAWEYGPVEPNLYRAVKMFGAGPIRNIFYSSPIDSELQDALDESARFLLTKTPGQLVSITHMKGGAWDRKYVPGQKHTIISSEDILAEYRLRASKVSNQVRV